MLQFTDIQKGISDYEAIICEGWESWVGHL